ncbi:DsbA family protein [Patescibacteria group bacterium]|nr:DsbA family protein [Patescibacteria group bacterium]
MNNGGKFVLKIILIIVALGAAVFLFQSGRYYYKIKTGKIIPNFSAATSAPKEHVAINPEEILNDRAPSFGATNPELTIIEFGSFSCPSSKKAAPIARELMIKYKDEIKFLYREFPIDELYEDSSALALVSKCSQAQNKFWLIHDKLYQFGSEDPLLLAKQAGLDENELKNCVLAQTYLQDIKQDLSDGVKNGVRGTPTFFFIKKGYEEKPIKIEGAIPKTTFEEIINKLLQNI